MLFRYSHSARGDVTVLDFFRSYDDLRFCTRRGHLIYGPCPICGLPLISAVLHAAQVIALDLGHNAISLPSTYLGDLLLSIRCTLYLSETPAEGTSRLGWIVPILEVGLVVLYYLRIKGLCCIPALSDADCKR